MVKNLTKIFLARRPVLMHVVKMNSMMTESVRILALLDSTKLKITKKFVSRFVEQISFLRLVLLSMNA